MQKKEERMDIAEVLARRRPQRIAKRAMDIVLSAAALAVLWPLLLLIALAVVIDDPGPVFYRQVRIGRGSWCAQASRITPRLPTETKTICSPGRKTPKRCTSSRSCPIKSS